MILPAKYDSNMTLIKSVHKILQINKFHPYKIRLVQELSNDDFDRRIEFCELMERINEDPNYLSNR